MPKGRWNRWKRRVASSYEQPEKGRIAPAKARTFPGRRSTWPSLWNGHDSKTMVVGNVQLFFALDAFQDEFIATH